MTEDLFTNYNHVENIVKEDVQSWDMIKMPIVGREDEAELIMDSFFRHFINGSKGQVIVVRGSTYSGKTHTVKYILENLKNKDLIEGSDIITLTNYNYTERDFMSLTKKFDSKFKWTRGLGNKKNISDFFNHLDNTEHPNNLILLDHLRFKNEEAMDSWVKIVNQMLRRNFSIVVTHNYCEGSELTEEFLDKIEKNPYEIEFSEYEKSDVIDVLKEIQKYSLYENVFEEWHLEKIANLSISDEKTQLNAALHAMENISMAIPKSESEREKGVEKIIEEELDKFVEETPYLPESS